MDYGPGFDQFLQNFRPNGNHPFYTLMEYMLALDRAAVPVMLKKTDGMKFDLVLHDVMFGGGNIIADKLKLPAIASCSSFVLDKLPVPPRMLEPGFHPQLDCLYEEIKEAQAEWGTEQLQISDIFFKKAKLVLVYTSRLFQPMSDNYDNSFCFVGPSVMDREEAPDFRIDETGTKKLVYISMGTVLNRCSDFYNKCIDAFSGQNYQVVMSVGERTEITALQQIPDNFIVRNYIPQLEVLRHSDVFISHGGLNSVSEAFYYGIPVIAIPLANDQPAVARRLAELGAGLELKMEEVTQELLAHSVHTILASQHYKDNSIAIGDSFRQAGGYQKAADEIIKFIK